MSTNPIDVNSTIPKGIQFKASSPVTGESETTKEVMSNKSLQPRLDVIELGNAKQDDMGTYTIDGKKLSEIKKDFSNHNESFKKMVRALFEKQGCKVNEILKALSEGKEVTIKIDSKTQETAQEAISEDGYWGVSKTAERILDFAKTLSGGDKTKIETLRNAFLEGFDKAKEAFGGTLPEISQQTYDKVSEGFDAWEKE